MTSNSDKELEQQLLEAGNKLLDPPPVVDELLPLLEQVESCLSKVEQSPTKSMQNALSPSQKALITDRLFKHSDMDVKVAVASCISEITRITAPDAPYGDDQMKDVFQLIVSSFENLDDKSSRSYEKRAWILETVSKVRSCVVMLDLECDALIVEMFKHFLKAIREYHPENVFSSMETIMSLVLDESEDISVELLTPLLDSVKKGNEEVPPVARKLGEKVLKSSAAKAKPYLIEAVKTLGLSLDDYSDVVGSICQETSDTAEQNDAHAGDENKDEQSKPTATSSDAAATVQDDEEITTKSTSPKLADPANDKSPKSAVSNGVAETGEDDSLADSDSLKKQDEDNHSDQLKSIDMPSDAEPDAERVVNAESKTDQTTENREKSPEKLAEPSESSHVDSEKEAEELPVDKKSGEDVPSSHEDRSVEEAVSSENKKDAGSQPSSPKALEGESVPASPSVSENPPDENVDQKDGKKKKESLNKDSAVSSDDVPKKVSEGTSDSEAKQDKHSGKKSSSVTSSEDNTPMTIDASKKESDTTGELEAKPLNLSSKKMEAFKKENDVASEPEAKPLKQSSKKVEASKKEREVTSEPEPKQLKQSSKKVDVSKKESDATGEPEPKQMKQSSKKVDASKKESDATAEPDVKLPKQSSKKVEGSIDENDSSSKQSEDKKKPSRGKAVSEKHATKSSAKNDDKEKTPSTKSATKLGKDEHHTEEAPTTGSKRKRVASDEKVSDIKEYDENVVGLKVEVWWPQDRQFYKGRIDSFDPVKKRHKVLYNDGDEEVLNLKRQRFHFIGGDDSESDEEEAADPPSPETSSERPLNKKVRTNSDKSAKQGKTDASVKKGSGASSSKSKSAGTKSGGKSKEVSKTDGKAADDSKAVKKSDDRAKIKDQITPKSASKSDGTLKTAGKSKGEDATAAKISKFKEDGTGTPKTSKSKHETPKTGKSKHDTPKVISSSVKSKSSKSGGKSDVNGGGKLKPCSSKVLQEIDDEETSTDSDKVQYIAKAKGGSSSSKGHGSEAKSGKKRRRA